MAKNKKRNNIRKFRKPLNLNPGMLIFAVIFLYVLICIFIYLNTKHIVRYQVVEGCLSTDNVYTGIAVRTEKVFSTSSAGYLNFYAREGSRVAVGDIVYTLDETGKLAEYLDGLNEGENTLTDDELYDFRNDIINFEHGFDAKNFLSIYDFKYTMKNSVLKLANSNILSSIDDIYGSEGSNVSFCTATDTGIVSYMIDGFEQFTYDQITESSFDQTSYTKSTLENNSLVESESPVYKLSTDENWSIVIPVEKSRADELSEMGYVKVKFLKNQTESWGKVESFTGTDGSSLVRLSFTNSMVTFVSDRFIQVELIVDEETGLKIPNSSIVSKEFYLIPKDYVVQTGDDNTTSIIKQSFLEDGSISSELVEVNVYSYDEDTEEYYIDSSVLNTGDVLYTLDSQNQFTVSKTATLIGVYNINKGYADFKQIYILSQNDEYAIIKPNTSYGLSVYDYIVLDAQSVTDNEFINN